MANFNHNKSPKQYKAFELLLKNFALAGITSDLARQSFRLNGAIFSGFLLLSLDISCILVFVANYAKQLDEYTQSVNTIFVLLLMVIILLILMVKMERLFAFIDSGNDLVNTRK